MPAKCRYEGCNRQSSLGFEMNKPLFCGQHRQEGMENVTIKRCLDEVCKKQPVFGLLGEKATHCKIHKTDEMVDVKHSKCGEAGCNKNPSYGIEKGKPLVCADHKSGVMRNVVSPECAVDGCTIQPCYNFDGESIKFCKGHADPEMINVKDMTCESCIVRPTFGIEGERARFCINHKTADMVDVKSQRCTVDNCPKRRYYAFHGNPAHFCEDHQEIGMMNVCIHRCEGEACSIHDISQRTSSNFKIDDRWVCMSCLRFERPTDARVVKLVTKEQMVLVEIRRRIPELDPFFKSWDRSITGGCSRKRPDMWFDFGIFHVILEIDENCHTRKSYNCEWRRMCTILQDGGLIPMIFLRINPDYDEDGKTAFKEHVVSSGDRIIRPVEEVFEERMDVIEAQLREILTQINSVPEKELDVRFFFYKERAVTSVDRETSEESD